MRPHDQKEPKSTTYYFRLVSEEAFQRKIHERNYRNLYVGSSNMSVSNLITESYQRGYLITLMAHKANEDNMRQHNLERNIRLLDKQFWVISFRFRNILFSQLCIKGALE